MSFENFSKMFDSSKFRCSIHKTKGNYIKYSYNRIQKARKIVVLLKAFDKSKKKGLTVEAKLGQVLSTTRPRDRRITCLSEHGSGQSKIITVISVRARGSNPGLESGELHLSYQLWLWYGNIRYLKLYK